MSQGTATLYIEARALLQEPCSLWKELKRQASAAFFAGFVQAKVSLPTSSRDSLKIDIMRCQDCFPHSKGKASAKDTQKSVDWIGNWLFQNGTELGGIVSVFCYPPDDLDSCNGICLPAGVKLVMSFLLMHVSCLARFDLALQQCKQSLASQMKHCHTCVFACPRLSPLGACHGFPLLPD